MNSDSKYRWPAKLKKFRIEDPFLKILATKYEREIPWQEVVRDSESLLSYVENKMLPNYLERVKYPPSGPSNLFVTANHVNLEFALRYQAGLDDDELSGIKRILSDCGEAAATEALVAQINRRKARAFKSWTVHLKRYYPGEPAFWPLVLRSMFELAGKGSRRDLFRPSEDIIEWLHRRIESEAFSPYENLSRRYCMKLAVGMASRDGWKFVPGGVQNAAFLSALCRGSGWCISGYDWAVRYLDHSSFYILYSNDRPVVALRCSSDKNVVVECQGRYNQSPYDWFIDICLFLETMDMTLNHRKQELDDALSGSIGDVDSKPICWWKDRAALWPFAIVFAPRPVYAELIDDVRESVIHYAGFNNFDTLKDLLGLSPDFGLSPDYWADLVESNPHLYGQSPAIYIQNPAVRQACLRGWLEKLRYQDMTLFEISTVPEFVSDSPEFMCAMREHVPSALKKLIRRHKGTYAERSNPFWLEEMLPLTENEPAGLVVERMVNVLLNNVDGIFADEKFPSIFRERDDFSLLRMRAWQEAITALPPLWFALPCDLTNLDIFQPTDSVPKSIDIESWSSRVEESTWLLTQKSGVPKSIRLHHRVLHAYRTGWERHLLECPWRIWIKRGGRRVYMSYALLADKQIIHTLTKGWLRCIRMDRHYSWYSASDRMRTIPALQYSMLHAIKQYGYVINKKEIEDIRSDIEDRCTRNRLLTQMAIAYWRNRHFYSNSSNN